MKDVYRSFYTKSNWIVDAMINSLDLEDNVKILEPSAGDGIFIDGIISQQNGKNFKVDAFEIEPSAIRVLKEKYQHRNNIKIYNKDTLTNENLTLYSDQGGIYDRVIANPPYGGWQDYEKRKKLKKLYNNFYTKETYTLFLHRSIDVTKPGGKIVFIIPDTFLNLHMHKRFRKFLLTVTKIKEIKLFPSSFFPDVAFGYSGLCIVTLEKCLSKKECLDNTIKIYQGFNKAQDLTNPNKAKYNTFQQREVYNNIDHTFFMTSNTKVTNLINNHKTKLANIADCVTGFYSGNNKKFLKVKSRDVKRSNGYEVANQNNILLDPQFNKDIINGIEGEKYLIPIVKGGSKYFYKETEWYVDWRKKSVKRYKESKKGRFQNSDYYFKNWGIGVPMVKTSYVTASTLDNRLFDQSIVGVFPHQKEHYYYLLALFNSPTISGLIELINPTANNSANYLKKLPILFPSDKRKEEIELLTLKLLETLRNDDKYLEKEHKDINAMIEDLYS